MMATSRAADAGARGGNAVWTSTQKQQSH